MNKKTHIYKFSFIYLFTFIILIIYTVQASMVNIEIKQKALELKGETDINTINNINVWVDSNIEYQFYWYPRSIIVTWKERKGDCTDKAILKSKMLKYNKIRNRIVHGYADGEKHDWIEWKLYDKWETNEHHYYDNLRKTGLGVW